MSGHGTPDGFDTRKAEEFAGRLLAVLNDGALCLMISIGHRTGLFDVMSGAPPATSAEIAAKSTLAERYVREWLGAMVTAEIVEMDPETESFSLPEEHAACMTRAAKADNMAVFAQYIGILGSVEDHVLDCFRRGGGVPYDRFPRFHEVMEEDSGQSVLSALESHIVPLVRGLKEKLDAGISVVDLGCGRGRIIVRLAELHPRSKFTGVDLDEGAVGFGRALAARKNLSNVDFQTKDLSDFDETAERGAYDLVTTFDAVHDQAKPLNLLKGIHRTLKDDGVYLMQDIRGSSHIHKNIGHPMGTLLYTISCMHCMTVSLAQGGEGLGAMWGEEKTREYLRNAGFGSVEKHNLAHDIQNNWYVVRK